MKRLFRKDRGEDHNFWMSYTDLLSGFLIVFIIASMIYYNKSNNYPFKYPQDKIDSLISCYEKMRLKGYDCDKLDSMIIWVDSLKEMGFDRVRIDSIMPLLSKHSIKDLDDAIRNVNKGDMIIVNREFASVFHNIDGVKTLDDLGVIRFYPSERETEMFKKNEADILPNLKIRLNKVAKPFIQKAMQLQREGGKIEIRIEGHADSRGIHSGNYYFYKDSFIDNLLLSSNRAIAVYNYIMNKCNLNDEEKKFLKDNVVAVGYSYARPIRSANGNEDEDKSRRIEFKIISE